MTARSARFEIVRSADGRHYARYHASNSRIVWWTETYRRESGALRAVEMFTGRPVTVSRWGLEVFHEGTAELLEVRRVDERPGKAPRDRISGEIDLDSEVWRDLPGDSRYQVSDQGRVQSRARGRWRFLSQSVNTVGYPCVGIRGEKTAVHQLVLLAFIGPCPPGLLTRHLNGASTDNRLSNLTYGTQSENMLDSVRHGTHHEASKTHCVRGHEYTPDNTRQRGDGTGRYCGECSRIRQRRSEAVA